MAKLLNSTAASKTHTLTAEQLTQLIAAAKAEGKAEAVAAAKNKPLTMKVSEKGALSIYGLHSRFPVTLYSQQWTRLLNHADTIRSFIEANKATLATKDAD